MLTGENNYVDAGNALGLDLVNDPDQALEPKVGARIAGWYWKTNGCNELADQNKLEAVRRRINGGVIGLDSVLSLVDSINAVV